MMDKWCFGAFFALCALVGLRPLMDSEPTTPCLNDQERYEAFPGWPEYLHGERIVATELSDFDRYFYRNLPGKLGVFETQNSELVIRWVETPTRLIHSSSSCFRSQGYAVDRITLERDRYERNWHAFDASRDGKVLHVRECVEDTEGQSWSDVSAWYWDCMLGRTKGPWWNYVVVEK